MKMTRNEDSECLGGELEKTNFVNVSDTCLLCR